MKILRRACGALLALALLDLVVIILTGGTSLLSPGAPLLGPLAFALRLVALGGLVGLRFRLLAEDALRLSGSRLLLVLLLLPTLFQFQFAGGRLGGDGVMYYVYVRSLMKDGDLDFGNEYTHYGLIDRGDLSMPTSTGRRRSIFAVGPGLLAVPAFAVGEVVARAQLALTGEADLSGYGPAHRNAVALGSLLYGFAAIVLIHGLLRRHFQESTALLAALAIWGTTFLHWYMVQQPLMSHAPSTLCAALVLWLWDRWRGALNTERAAALGLALGLAMCVRWQNGVLLLLPGLDLLRQARAVAVPALALGLGTLGGAFPQMAAWKEIYGEYLLRYPPHGADFLRLDHPFLLETFFSSRHGLFSWTPALWFGYLGFLPLYRRRRSLALALLAPLVLMSYVNACSGDWWAGGSFSNRRFDSLLPVLAFGFAAAIDAARGLLRAQAGMGLLLCAAPFVAWNLSLADAMQRAWIPRDDTIAFSRLVGSAARALSETVGFPTTFPASWIFAWRHDLPVPRFDLIVGRYLFYRQNNLGGTIDLANLEHASLLAEGFSRVTDFDGAAGRLIADRARLLVPLDTPEPLEIRLFVQALPGPAEVRVTVNGREAGRLHVLAGAWQELRVAVPGSLWRRELNDVVIETQGAALAVSAVRFTRSPQA